MRENAGKNGLRVDTDTGVLRRDRVLVQRNAGRHPGHGLWQPNGWQSRSEEAKQYQEQVTDLPRGVDVEFRGVRFDGCRESDGTMLEAKGIGYAWAMKGGPNFFDGYKGERKIMDQAWRQAQAAVPDRWIEWHFVEEPVANYFREEFKKEKYRNITVLYDPYVPRAKKWASWIRKYMSIGITAPRAPPLVPFDWRACLKT